MGAAGVLSLLGSLTGIGLESCVAVTGEVDVRGGLHAVDGLEGKLTWASANPVCAGITTIDVRRRRGRRVQAVPLTECSTPVC